jgi:hypothetical protein
MARAWAGSISTSQVQEAAERFRSPVLGGGWGGAAHGKGTRCGGKAAGRVPVMAATMMG